MDSNYIKEKCAEMFGGDKEKAYEYFSDFLNSIVVTDHMKEDGVKKIFKKMLDNPGFEIHFR